MSVDLVSNGAWARDVVLVDGSTACIRTVRAGDGPSLADLHSRLSPETVRLRYLGAHPRLSEEELARLVRSDADQCVLVVERGNQLIACAQYDRVPGSDVA